ncbi:MAG: ArsR/SmtB family transcription factor [Planctomycetota bacterium]|jgi:ArsR family transcriptional regulator
MDSETGKVYELKALVLKALAHPLRLAVVDFLADGERCVCEIAEHVGAERSNVSRHLALMLRAGILECRRDGLKVLYTLKTPCVLDFLSCATNVLREQIESSRAVLSRL